jgi:tetratricopeptide (TPR) repeat protein
VAYCATGQVDLAEYDEQKVVALGGTSNKCSERVAASINRDSAVNSFGTVYVDLVNNKYEAAVAKITKVIATYPLHEAYYKRAEIYHLHLKNPALALADVLTLLKLNPNHEEAAALKATLIGAPGQK